MSVRPAIFDMDGTLVDSVQIVCECFQETMRELAGREYPVETFLPFIGPPLADSFRSLGAEDTALYVSTYRSFYEKRHLDVPLFPGVREMIERLHSAGVPMAIATTKKHENAHLLAEHLGIADKFLGIFGSNEATGRVAKHFVVEDALAVFARAGIDASDAVMVGDRRFDIEGAAQHGVRTILVGWGPTPDEEYAMAWRVGATPQDVADIILAD